MNNIVLGRWLEGSGVVADGGMIYNPSTIAVWVDVNGKPSKIEAGECLEVVGGEVLMEMGLG